MRERFLDDVNNVFFDYYYSFKDFSFREDDLASEINGLIELSLNNRNYGNIEDWLLPAIPSWESHLYEFRVFHVGQANCSALIKYNFDKSDYRVVAVFDFGCELAYRNNKALNEMIDKIDCSTVILISHFDLDHFNNIADHLLVTTCRWIFPDYDGKKKKASKIFQVLLKVALRKTGVARPFVLTGRLALSPNIQIAQRPNTWPIDPYQSSMINSRCVVSSISINGKNVLIPADALYSEIRSEIPLFDDGYDYVLVPHHGCNYRESSEKPSSGIIGDKTVGVVLCGKNHYGHASISHLSLYNRLFLFEGSQLYDSKKHLLAKTKDNNVDFFTIEF